MVTDTHLATLQAMGITLYTPRTHEISFDETLVENTRSSESVNSVGSGTISKRASASSATHIDQIKSLLKGKNSADAVEGSKEAKIKTRENNALTSTLTAQQSSSHSSQQMSSSDTAETNRSAEVESFVALNHLVSAQWLSDFQICLPEPYRNAVAVSQSIQQASVINEQLVLPHSLIKPAPHNKALYQQILALYNAGEQAHD